MRERYAPPGRTSPSRRAEDGSEALPGMPVTLGATLVVEGAAEVLGARLPAGEYEPPPLSGHALAVNRSGPHRMAWRVDGRATELTIRTGDVWVAPARRPCALEARESLDFLNVVLSEDFVGRIAERAGVDYGRMEVLGVAGVRDPQLGRLLASFLPEMGEGGFGGELYAEALATQLAVQLLRGHSSLGRRAQDILRRPAAPDPRAISRAVNYLNDNLSGGLSLVELAEAAGYSSHHFARLFKEATGLPPHRYVVARRIERARRLLEGTDLPLAEVARTCGFSNQSHMGRTVKALTGITPARLRREARR